jgi:hypothetical protein
MEVAISIPGRNEKFVKVLKPALGPAHLLTQRVPAYLSPEVQQTEHEHEHSSVSSAELKHTGNHDVVSLYTFTECTSII